MTATSANLEGGRVQVQPGMINAEAVLEEIEVQIDLLDTLGGKYARDYLAHALGILPLPQKPRGMHPLIAKALRDLASDEATAIRLYGPARPRSDFAPGQRAAPTRACRELRRN